MVLKKSVVDFYFGPLPEQKVASIHIRRKRRNLFVTLTDLSGAVLGSISAKTLVSDRKRRFAAHIIEFLIKRVVVMLKAYRVEYVRLFFKSVKARFLRPVMHALRADGVSPTMFVDLVPVAHNGCRRKKVRRI